MSDRPRATEADKIAFAAPLGSIVTRPLLQVLDDHPRYCWCDDDEWIWPWQGQERPERVDLEAGM